MGACDRFFHFFFFSRLGGLVVTAGHRHRISLAVHIPPPLRPVSAANSAIAPGITLGLSWMALVPIHPSVAIYRCSYFTRGTASPLFQRPPPEQRSVEQQIKKGSETLGVRGGSSHKIVHGAHSSLLTISALSGVRPMAATSFR